MRLVDHLTTCEYCRLSSRWKEEHYSACKDLIQNQNYRVLTGYSSIGFKEYGLPLLIRNDTVDGRSVHYTPKWLFDLYIRFVQLINRSENIYVYDVLKAVYTVVQDDPTRIAAVNTVVRLQSSRDALLRWLREEMEVRI